MKYMIVANNLVKRFKKEKGKGVVEALKGVSLNVKKERFSQLWDLMVREKLLYLKSCHVSLDLFLIFCRILTFMKH